ncbi:hypothetical protein [Sphingobacterium wenxiniae]|uniref:Uncharacterized protein n=1 Tax=Sphingobacterium wenxiniae TaxID=683125 RepID=A0A1I6THR6_9SPHI|nr:hypothetical protein [Sphingobacterium wenxiniae]SFS88688.1 hypothetical protein SAMN05660206_106155 [Sphingobacterium wenxiniae]
MTSIDRKFITENILKLLDYSGVADSDFANLIEKSSRTMVRIRKGEALFTIESINIATQFFDKTLDELNTIKVEFEENYRNKLKDIHKSNTSFYAVLEKRPTITYAIKYYLLEYHEFQTSGMIVDKINDFFNSLGWEYSSSYISSSMSRHKKQIYVAGTKIVDGNKVNVYKKK